MGERWTVPAHCHPGNLGEKGKPETRNLGIIWHSWLSTVRLESDTLDRIKECQAWESRKPCSPTPHLINGEKQGFHILAEHSHHQTSSLQGPSHG